MWVAILLQHYHKDGAPMRVTMVLGYLQNDRYHNNYYEAVQHNHDCNCDTSHIRIYHKHACHLHALIICWPYVNPRRHIRDRPGPPPFLHVTLKTWERPGHEAMKFKPPETMKSVGTGSTCLGKREKPASDKPPPVKKPRPNCKVGDCEFACMIASWENVTFLAVLCKCLVIDAY